MIRSTPVPHGLNNRLAEFEKASVVARVWAGDHTVWGPSPDEIANRLGWLRAPQTMRESLAEVKAFARSTRAGGCDTVALLGMGGSSLAAETLARIAHRVDGPEFLVLDTTHPATILRALDRLDVRKTLFLVSTKSGTTSETLSLFRIFHQRACESLGRDAAGSRFAAITDPGSPLVRLAHESGFRRVFLNDPTFGGRYAALSLVGLVPAAVLGLDIEALLDSGAAMAVRCGPSVQADENPAALLAALLAAHADEGRDKATFVLPQAVESFGDWAEQLIAESTGKRGTGIVPVVGEPLGLPGNYGTDRVFLRFGNGTRTPDPAIECEPITGENLGGQFYLWEMATALVGHLLGVNPFDQPDVEAAKQATRDILIAYRERGEVPCADFARLDEAALRAVTAQARPGDYVALLAYLDRRPEIAASLRELRRTLRDATACATTLGFGPRFLHSTGQLHKGDGGRGLFLELVDEPSGDIDVPSGDARPASLGLILRAQALGDARALSGRGRRVQVLSLGSDAQGELARIPRLPS